MWQKREMRKEKKKGHQEHTKTLFSTHMIPLQRSRQENFNNTLIEHRMRL
jgi:hypothetical protein